MLYKIALRQKMDQAKTLTTYMESACLEINEEAVVVKKNDSTIANLKADQVIICTGLRPKAQLAESFYGITSDIAMIGDCNAPRLILDATFEGYSIAVNI